MRLNMNSRIMGRTNSLMDYCVIFACLMWATSASIISDECDWTGSGLTSTVLSRGVTPIYLRCTTGRVIWLYPRGALRVLLRLPGQDREFRACIKVHRDDTDRSIPARLYLEGPTSLHPLYTDERVGSKAIKCFNSKSGLSAIYLEATDGNSLIKRVAEIEYDLQPLPRGSHGFNPTEECRPCTSEELAHAFCTSDLVTRGTIHSVENIEELEVSQILVKITKLIRHTTEDGYYRDIESNSLDNNSKTHMKEVTIHVAQHCGVSHGTGEFVFMARRKLGDLTMQCAPRLEDWALLINKLSQEGKSHCILRS